MCGLMRKFYDDHVNLIECNKDKLPFHYICEFDPPEDSKQTIQLADLQQTANVSYRVPSIPCPQRHWTHEFLACDAESECWTKGNVGLSTVRPDWDTPASSWCDVTSPSFPLYFLCSQGVQRVPFTLVCDSRADCVDRSDEDFCLYRPCSPDKPRKCGNTRQVGSVSILSR